MAKDYKEALNIHLDDCARFMSDGNDFQSKFDAHFLDVQEGEIGLPALDLFEQSKLNPKKAGHWQVLLSLVALALYSKRTGRKILWNREAQEKLFRAVVKRRRESVKSGSKKSVEAICKELKDTKEYKTTSSAEALHARFNIIIRKKRSQAKEKDASPALKRDLKYFSSI